MKYFFFTILFAVAAAHSEASSLDPVFSGNIRDIPIDGIGDFLYPGQFQHGNLAALDAEDRGIVEFDRNSLSSVQSAHLVAAERFSSVGQSTFLTLYGYSGDGLFSLSDFSLGSKLFSFEHKQGETLNLDVTDFVKSSIASGYDFIGFNLRQDTITSSGLVLYQSVAFEVSSIPEPSTVWLATFALWSLVLKSRWRSHVT